jgi:hypothetical protein
MHSDIFSFQTVAHAEIYHLDAHIALRASRQVERWLKTVVV